MQIGRAVITTNYCKQTQIVHVVVHFVFKRTCSRIWSISNNVCTQHRFPWQNGSEYGPFRNMYVINIDIRWFLL